MLQENPKTTQTIAINDLQTVTGQQILGAKIITINPHIDNRGYFGIRYRESDFLTVGLPIHWPEEYDGFNEVQYTVRGFHFQSTDAQSKLIRVSSGSAMFVLLDIRTESTTFGQWISVTQSENDHTIVFVPAGCAVCMCTLEPNTRLIYKMDKPFKEGSYESIVWNSPELQIPWPVNTPALISDKDANAQTFSQFLEKNNIPKVK